MSFDEFSFAARALRPVTDYLYLHVMGEPLTHPELITFINYAGSLGFKCSITTNATLIKKRCDELLNSQIYKVNISVHSFEDGSDEAYYSYLEDIAEFSKKASDKGFLTVLRLWNKGFDNGRNDKTLEFFKKNIDGEWKWNERGARIKHKLHLEWGERFSWPDANADYIGDEVFCYGLSDHFGVLADGRVVPCCLDREGEITLGNIFDTPIEDILSSERAKKMVCGFSKRQATEELCRRCGYARRFK